MMDFFLFIMLVKRGSCFVVSAISVSTVSNLSCSVEIACDNRADHTAGGERSLEVVLSSREVGQEMAACVKDELISP